MAPEVPQHIRQRLASVIHDLRNAYLARLSTAESADCESIADKPGISEDSWMEYINENCMTDDASDSSYPTTFSLCEKMEVPLLQKTYSQTETNTHCPSRSPQIANPVSSGKDITATLCERCKCTKCESKTHHVKRRSEHNILDTVVQGLPRSNLLDCLKTYWEILRMEGIFAIPTRQVCGWTLEGSSEQVHRLHHHLILRHLDVEDDLHQWRRSIAEMRNLDGYTSFFAEVQVKQRCRKRVRQSGENNSNKAHKEYLAHIYADRTPEDYKRAKQALKKDLRHGRRWSILVDGFAADDGDVIPGLGLGLLLLCGASTAKKMSYAHLRKEGLLTSIAVTILRNTTILI